MQACGALKYLFWILWVFLLFSFPCYSATFFYINSESGDYIGQGQEKTITDANHSFTVTQDAYQRIGISIFDGVNSGWNTNFSPKTNDDLVVDLYENAILLGDSLYPGLNVKGEGRECNTASGKFYIHELVVSASNEVTVFAADFEQFCDGASVKLNGAIRVNSVVPVGPMPIAIDVSPADYAYGTDGSATTSIDGVYDIMTTGTKVLANKYNYSSGSLERRGAYEFALPTVLADPSVTLNTARLKITEINSGGGFGDSLIAYGYSADGVVKLGDFANTATSLGYSPISGNQHEYEVGGFVNSLIGNSSHAGFNLAVSWWDAYATLSPEAQLRIVYSVHGDVANINPELAINSPVSSNTYYENTSISFSATAIDPNDGDISASIIWHSPLFQLPTGAAFEWGTFPPGTHTVTASVQDSFGATANVSVTFTVIENSAPTLTII